MARDDEIGRWIIALRDRLGHGDLAGLGPIDLGYGTGCLPATVMISTMLADLADLDDPEGSAANDPQWHEERHHDLLEDFRRLRDLIG